MLRRIPLIFHSNIILTLISVAIPFFCSGATYDMTVEESRSFTPFNSTKYRNAVYAGMSLSDDSAFEISSSSSSTNPYNVTYKLKALKTGTYKVTFSIQYKNSNNYVWDNFTHTINVYDVTSINIPSSVSLIVGEKYTFSPIVEDNKATTTLKWNSDNTAIVSTDGPTITAKSIGSAIITCEAHNGVKAVSRVSVSPVLVNSICLNFQDYNLPLFAKLQLKAEVLPSNASNQHIQWSSSNNDVAIVREDGIVIDVKCGYSLISAKAIDSSGVSASCLVKVVEESHDVKFFSISDSGCGKIEIKYDDGYSIRPIPFEGWQIYSITTEDGTALPNDEGWINISNLERGSNYTIIWENISTSASTQLINSKIFCITNRTIRFIEEGFNRLEICDIQGRVIYQGPCQNISLPSSGNFIISIDNKIFKISIP